MPKDTFSFDNMIDEQIDGVSMGSPLAPVLANIIMTELEKTIVQKLTTSGMIKFYCRYVDDTLLLVEPTDILHIHNLFNKFDKNLYSGPFRKRSTAFLRHKNILNYTNKLPSLVT